MTGRRALPALAVVALTTVAVVALGDPDAETPQAVTVVSAGAMVAVFIAVATGIEHRDQHPFPFGVLLMRLSPVPLVLLGILSVGLVSGPAQDSDIPGGLGGGEEREVDPRGSEKVEDFLDVVYAVLGLLAVAAAVYLIQRLIRGWVRVRRTRAAAPVPGPAGVVTESDDPERWRRQADRLAVRGGLERGRAALLDETDPRLAIVRAYLAFEDHVRREGLVREPVETQREYAARVLAAGGVSEPRHVTELVELFNAARFSTDPIDDADAAAARAHMDSLVGA